MSRTEKQIHPRYQRFCGGPNATPLNREFLDRCRRGYVSQSRVADLVQVDGDILKESYRDCGSALGKRFCKKLVRRARRRTESASYEVD